MGKRSAVLALVAILAMSPFLPAIPAGAQDPAPEAAATPEDSDGLVHTVVKGDTLWDLSAKYLGSPWLWPELWQRNRFLTNPHYIYPGIRVVVFHPSSREYEMEILQPAPEAAPAEAPPSQEVAMAEEAPPAPAAPAEKVLAISHLDMVRAGLFLPERPSGIGNIRAGVDTRVAFSEGDKVFLSLAKEIPSGQLLGVYRVRGPVRAPSGSSVSGYVRYLIGILQVRDPEDGRTTAVVRKSFEDLSRSDQILEEIPAYAPVVLNPGEENLEAVVLTGRMENTEFSNGTVVYLDKGTDAGVAVGNLFRVQAVRGEASWTTPSAGGERGPVEVARVVVVRTLPGSSSAYVVSGTQSFSAGARARRGTGSR